MSDLSIYELDDIVWDDFEHSGDHIVPHPTDNKGSEDKCESDISKKPRLDVAPIQSNEERGPNTLNKETNLMEKDTWSNMLDSVFAASGDADSAKDTPTSQSGDTRLSNRCFESSSVNGSGLCTDDGILKDSSDAVNRNSYNDLNLFSNDYDWPDVGYFEDVDRMLSNCDSSFGLNVTGNGDELVWFSSEDPTRGFEETMKMDLKLPCSEPSSLTNVSQGNEPRESDNNTSSFVSESKDEIKGKDQKEQSRQQNLAESVDYMQSTMQSTGGSMMTGIKSEIKGSSQVHSMESSSQPLFTGNQNQSGMIFQASGNNLEHMIENKIKFHNTEGVKKGSSAELDSSDVPDGSSLSVELDEISLEATTFRQLTQVLLQLDLRTKLCIRDSLYRLARSAEQRHDFVGINVNYGGAGGPVSKYTGLMDMETDTNPIDRTVAHLLFHRPTESFNMPTSLPSKPNVKGHGSKTGPAIVTKKPPGQQVESESDDKISSSRKN